MQLGVGSGSWGNRGKLRLRDEARECIGDGRRSHLVLLPIGIYESFLSEVKGIKQLLRHHASDQKPLIGGKQG
jgi:hypothetical protein